MVSCLDLRKCVMAFDCGPDSAVCTPGAIASWLSREVANVKVTKGLGDVSRGSRDDGRGGR